MPVKIAKWQPYCWWDMNYLQINQWTWVSESERVRSRAIEFWGPRSADDGRSWPPRMMIGVIFDVIIALVALCMEEEALVFG